jgi:hypothetical protein
MASPTTSIRASVRLIRSVLALFVIVGLFSAFLK